MDNKAYSYWLANIHEIGAVTIKRMLGHFKSARGVYEAKASDLVGLFKIPVSKAERIVAHRAKWNLEAQWESFLARNIGFVTTEEESYPSRLKNIYDPPYSLFYLGELPSDDVPAAAVVGARECTEYGASSATEMGATFARARINVISGMARGVDSYAHKGALNAGGNTYAVIGCGVNVVYPPENKALYDRIIKSGGVISEFPPDIMPIAKNFPMRNRIISGLSDQVYVVEARERSGSLITADMALEQGRDVYALPGKVTDGLSSGCNRLIRQGAGIILSIDELASDFEGVDFMQTSLFDMDESEAMCYRLLSLRPTCIAEICEKTCLEYEEVCEILDRLESKGKVKENYLNHYSVL